MLAFVLWMDADANKRGDVGHYSRLTRVVQCMQPTVRVDQAQLADKVARRSSFCLLHFRKPYFSIACAVK
jgi:hypothetical protein